MNEQQYVIEFGPDGRATVDANDLPWLDDKVRREPGPITIRLRTDDSDTEGHGMVGTGVRVILEDGDDTEGHALSLNFPTLAEADAFRRRLVLAGVLAGTVAFGAVAGVGLSNLSIGEAGTAGAAEAASGQYVSENMGGTTVAAEAASGQYVSENMGGTTVAAEAASDDDANAPSIGGPTPR